MTHCTVNCLFTAAVSATKEKVPESMFMIYPRLPVSVAGTLVPANIYLSWGSAVPEQVSLLLLWPIRGIS